MVNIWNLVLKTYRFEWDNVFQLYEGFKAAYDLKPELYAFLESKTKKVLLNYLYQISQMSYHRDKNEKKDYIIKTIVDKLYLSFHKSDKSGFIVTQHDFSAKPDKDKGEYMNKRIKTQWTEENYQEAKKLYREENAAQLKAVENPETLEEFKKAENKRDLTEQEKQLYLELQENDLLKLAERIRQRTIEEKEAKRIKNAAAKAVDADTDFIVKESIHTKTGDTLYLVEPTNRVDKDTYRQLLSRAKKLGGFWSRWDKAFRFPSIEIANQFANIKQEVKKEEEVEDKDTWTKFRESAAKIETKSDDIINADRKVNTGRRMRMAQGVIQDAENRIYFASLLRALADMQQDGSAKFLNWLQFQTELEMLINLESYARQSYLRKTFDNSSRLSYSDQLEEVRNLPLDLRFREYIKPGICLQVQHWKRFADDGISVSGAKQFSKTILKYIKGRKENELFCLPTHYYSNLQTALKKVIKNSYSHNYLQETFTNSIRLQKLGLDNKEVLFAALKELQKVKELAAEKYEHEKSTKIDFELETLRQSKDAQKTFDYFATPDSISKEVIELADIEPGARVLEPSAGDGQLIRAVREAQPTATIDAIEKQYRLQEYLKKQGFNVVASELETFNPDYKYDAIVMNPPFSNRQDAEHIIKAYSLLKPGGKLVAIMSEGTFNASDKKSKAFQNLYLQAGIYDKKLIGVFKEMGTNVNTRLIVLEGMEGISGIEEPKRSNKMFAIGTLATIFYLAAKQKSNAKN